MRHRDGQPLLKPQVWLSLQEAARTATLKQSAAQNGVPGVAPPAVDAAAMGEPNEDEVSRCRHRSLPLLLALLALRLLRTAHFGSHLKALCGQAWQSSPADTLVTAGY